MPDYNATAELAHCIERERVERAAAGNATNPLVAASHFMMAERYADRAWSIAERHDLPYTPSGLWPAASAQSPRMETPDVRSR